MTKHAPSGESAEMRTMTAPPNSGGSRHAVQAPSPLPQRLLVPEVSDLVVAACQHPLKTFSLAMFAAAAGAILAWIIVSPLYKASSLVRVRLREDYVFTAQQTRAEDAQFTAAQKELVLEPQVLASALQRPELVAVADWIPDDAPLEWLAGQIRVENPRASEVMSIAGVHPDPAIAQAVCNAVTAAYLDEITKRLQTARDLKEAGLERAAQKADELLNAKWLQLHAIADEVGSGNSQSLTVRDQIQLQAYREYAQQLRSIQLEGNSLESQLAEDQQRIQEQEELVEATVQGLVRSHPEVVAARERLEHVEAEIREIKPLIPHQETPQMLRLMQQRKVYAEDLRVVLAEVEPELRENALTRLASNRQAAAEQRKDQLEMVRSEEAFLRNTLAELESQMIRSGDDNGIRLDMVRHEIERQERLADGLWQSLEQLKIESLAPPRIALIAMAPLPKNADRSRQLKAIVAASAIGVIAVIFGIGYVEWRSCRIRHLEDLTARAKLAAYGFYGASSGWSLLRPRRPDAKRFSSGPGEAVSQMILHGEQRSEVMAVAVSSATDAEPRAVVALEMALVFASFGRRTLLVDADVAGAEISRRTKAKELEGLADLQSPSDASRFVYATTHQLLDLMPAGVAPREVLRPTSRLLQELREAISDQYDAIVINSPAVLGTAESVLIAAQADQTVLVAVQGSSRWDQAAGARHRAEAAGLTVLGSVLHTGKPAAEAKQLAVAADRPKAAMPRRRAPSRPAPASRPADAAVPRVAEASPADRDAEEQLQTEIDELRTDLRRSTADGLDPDSTPQPTRTASP